MKALRFVGSSLDDLRRFPTAVRRQAGFEIDTLQRGFEPGDWKPVSNAGTGVCEIRIHTAGEWRVIYLANRADAIYILHAFQKKTQKIRNQDMKLIRQRLQQIED